jgi:SP family sugar:H+ symporter-like MFS transporter
MLGEKFPNQIRASALAVSASAQWIANWAISTSFPSLKDAGLGLAYGIYAAFALLSFVFVRLAITETKGHELEDMPQDVRARVPARAQRARREALADEPGCP